MRELLAETATKRLSRIAGSPVNGYSSWMIISLFGKWFGHVINRQTDLTLRGEAGGVSEAMRETRRHAPDAVAVDISLGGSSEAILRDQRD